MERKEGGWGEEGERQTVGGSDMLVLDLGLKFVFNRESPNGRSTTSKTTVTYLFRG